MRPVRADWPAVLKPGDFGGGASIHVTFQLCSFVDKNCDLIGQIAACATYDRGHFCRDRNAP